MYNSLSVCSSIVTLFFLCKIVTHIQKLKRIQDIDLESIFLLLKLEKNCSAFLKSQKTQVLNDLSPGPFSIPISLNNVVFRSTTTASRERGWPDLQIHMASVLSGSQNQPYGYLDNVRISDNFIIFKFVIVMLI